MPEYIVDMTLGANVRLFSRQASVVLCETGWEYQPDCFSITALVKHRPQYYLARQEQMSLCLGRTCDIVYRVNRSVRAYSEEVNEEWLLQPCQHTRLILTYRLGIIVAPYEVSEILSTPLRPVTARIARTTTLCSTM